VSRDLCQRHCLPGIVGGGSKSGRAISDLIQKKKMRPEKFNKTSFSTQIIKNFNEIESNLKFGRYLDSMDTCHAIHDTIVFALLPYDSHDLFDFKNDRQ
jgi:hypothetical protein